MATHNKETREKYDIIRVDEWKCPTDTGVPVLTMPNVYRALHGVAPRTVLGSGTWNRMRKKCCFDAGYKCEACGAEGTLHAHELYDTNWKEGYAKFRRCVALCPLDHVYFIHSGRALTLFKQGSPLYPASKLLEGAEHGFKQVYEWNESHPEEESLRVYATFVDYLKEPDLKEPMEKLIKKYNIKFYFENENHVASWKDWRLIIGDKEYPTPYKSRDDWQKAMDERNKSDPQRSTKNPFKGGVYEEWDKIIKENSGEQTS